MKNNRGITVIELLFVLAVLSLLALAIKATANEYCKNEPYTPAISVTRVIDGDTIVISTGEKVRLLGVDTPELHHPSKPVQCYAEEAKRFTESQVLNKVVVLAFEGASKDKYGRILAWVWYGPNNRTLLNAEIIRQGYGFSYRKYPTSKMEMFNRFEQEARSKQLGLWNSQNCPQK
jgi:micrococcal nuclease